jgi:hypothetical protein
MFLTFFASSTLWTNMMMMMMMVMMMMMMMILLKLLQVFICLSSRAGPDIFIHGLHNAVDSGQVN